MTSKLIKYIIVFSLLIMSTQNSFSEELFINASSVEIDKTGKTVFAKGNVEIYDKDKNLIAVAKLATPVKKTEERDLTFKLKLDI